MKKITLYDVEITITTRKKKKQKKLSSAVSHFPQLIQYSCVIWMKTIMFVTHNKATEMLTLVIASSKPTGSPEAVSILPKFRHN